MALTATWSECVQIYNVLTRVTSGTGVGSAQLEFAETEVQGYLSSHFTVPFSNNNLTVKQLVIDMTYLKVGNLNLDDASALREQIYERMNALKNGSATMMSNSGESLGTTDKSSVYSTTQNYHPVFGMSPTTSFIVDSSQVYDEEVARGNI